MDAPKPDAPEPATCSTCGKGHDENPFCSSGFHSDPKPKKPGLFSKLGSAVGEAVGSWFAGRGE
jgi:hypothetical protein